MPIKIKNKTYTAIIFDIDDTLIDTSESYDEAIKKTVKNFTNIDITNKHINLVRSYGISYGVNNDWNVTWLIIQLLKNFDDEKWELVFANKKLNKINPKLIEYIEIKNFFQNIYLGTPYFNGQGLIDIAEKKIYQSNFFPILKKLGVKIAVVTSRPTVEALYTLKNVNGLLNEFIENEHFIISAGDKNIEGKLIAEKPSPEPILECVKRLQITVKECVYIGNSASDYIAATDANMDFIQVGTSKIERYNTQLNYFKFNTVNDIISNMNSI